jgi:hypothetical protein
MIFDAIVCIANLEAKGVASWDDRSSEAVSVGNRSAPREELRELFKSTGDSCDEFVESPDSRLFSKMDENL